MYIQMCAALSRMVNDRLPAGRHGNASFRISDNVNHNVYDIIVPFVTNCYNPS